MADSTQSRSQDAMRRLRERRTDLAEWYGGLRHGSAGAWSEVTTGFADSYRAMSDALRRARDEFQQPSRTPSAAPGQEKPAEDQPAKEKPTTNDGTPSASAANGP
jgi:hypothetical protein